MATDQGKIVLDPIYGIIHLDALTVKIIDTDEFQRLRYIKQLSFADFVHPGATHTRFVHSIGLDRQRTKGLYLLFEVLQNWWDCFKHETISQFLVKKILMSLPGIDDYFIDKKKKKREDFIQLIKDLIEGDFEKYREDEGIKNKTYMFQIVSNNVSGVDVDKWDYFNRDARACGVPETFQYDRAFSVARVVKTEEETYELGYRDEDAFSFYNMFNTRFTMYRKVYCHKFTDAVGLMIKDVLDFVNKGNNDETNPFVDSCKIDPFPIQTIPEEQMAKNPSKYLASDADISSESSESESSPQVSGRKYLVIDEYLKLRDDVLLKIQDSTVSQYEEARDLIQRLRNRKLYRLVDEIKIQKAIKTRLEEFKDFKDDVEILERKFNYGKDHDDSIRRLYFYKKNADKKWPLEGTHLQKDTVSFVLPSVFEEYHIRVYEKFSGKEADVSKVTTSTDQIRVIVQDIREKHTTQHKKLAEKENLETPLVKY